MGGQDRPDRVRGKNSLVLSMSRICLAVIAIGVTIDRPSNDAGLNNVASSYCLKVFLTVLHAGHE
jgi:hypothetical protein